MKKIIQLSTFLIILGVFILPTNSFANSVSTGFTDTSSHWAKKYIDYLANNKIVTGTDGSSFEPDRNITRSEFSVMLAKAMKLDSTVTSNTYFPDVKSTDWFAGYVNSVASFRIFNIYGDGTFHPNEEITREDMAVMIVRALDVKGVSSHIGSALQTEVLSKFTDSNELVMGKEEVSDVLNANVMKGISDKTFGPREKATRAQASAVLVRFLSIFHPVRG
jgi:hypothetical protein